MDISKTTNLYVIKCYKLLFDKNIIKNNVGSYIILAIIFIYIALLIVFIIKGYTLFFNRINALFEKKEKERERKPKKVLTQRKKEGIKIFEKNAPPKLRNKNKNYNGKMKRNSSTCRSNGRLLNNTHRSEISLDKNSNIKAHKKGNIKHNKNNDNKIDKISKSNLNYDTLNDYEFNSLNYEKAAIYDKRTFCKYYISLLKMKHLLIFTFYTRNDYNSYIIKICLFLFSFSLYITVNAFFFTETTIHQIYKDEGFFNFIYQIPQILYSLLISSFINIILSFLSLTQKNIVEMKNGQKNKENKDFSKLRKCINIKFIIFFILSFLFLILFWFYLGCFCAVFQNTQMHLIKDTFISFGLSLVYPLSINVIPGILRIVSLNSKKKNSKSIYNFSKMLQLL